MTPDQESNLRKRFPRQIGEFERTGMEMTFKNIEEWARSQGVDNRYYAIALSKL